MVPRHICEKCLEYMYAEKEGDKYVLKCPACEREKSRQYE